MKSGASGGAAVSDKSPAEKTGIGDRLPENIQAEDLSLAESEAAQKGQIEGQVSMFGVGPAA